MNLYTLRIQSVLRCIAFVYSFRCDSRIFRAQPLLRSFLHNPFFYIFLITATVRFVAKPSYIDVSYIDSFGCIGSSDVYKSFNLTNSFSRCYFSLGTMAAPKKQICKGWKDLYQQLIRLLARPVERYHTRDSPLWLDTLIHSNLIDSLYGSTSTGTSTSPMADVNTDKALLDRVRDMF